MKCPECVNGRVILFTSSRTCERCGGTGAVPEPDPHGDVVHVVYGDEQRPMIAVYFKADPAKEFKPGDRVYIDCCGRATTDGNAGPYRGLAVPPPPTLTDMSIPRRMGEIVARNADAAIAAELNVDIEWSPELAAIRDATRGETVVRLPAAGREPRLVTVRWDSFAAAWQATFAVGDQGWVLMIDPIRWRTSGFAVPENYIADEVRQVTGFDAEACHRVARAVIEVGSERGTVPFPQNPLDAAVANG